MPDYSQHKRLELPKSVEKYNVAVANKNNMVIDSELHKLDLKNQSQDELLATKEALEAETLRSTNKEIAITSDLSNEVSRAKSVENELSANITNEINRAITTESSMNENFSTLISNLTERLNTLADSDDTTLDQLSEIVAYIKNNKNLIDGVTTNKVDKVDGKGLSTNDYTTDEKNKLSGIASGAEVNVQADWNITDANSDDYIKNKPTIPTVNNGTLTIQKNGTNVQTFTANQSGNVTANITVPTKTSELTNDSGFKTTDNNTWKANSSSSEGYVASGSGQANKVWKTDANGNPAWRDDTDTNTWRGIQNNLISDSTTDSLAAAQGKALKTLVDGKAASNHNHNGYYAYDKANVSGTMNDVAGYRNAMGMINLSNPSSGTASYVNPDGQTGWHHFINISYADQVGSNMWQTQIANKAGTTDLWVRSRSGGSVDNSAQWVSPWTRVLTASNYTKVFTPGGIVYSDSEPTSLTTGMTWIGN